MAILGVTPGTRRRQPTLRHARPLPPDQTAPTWPNPGTYDPTFDVNVGMAQRGYQYGLSDHTRDWGELGTAGGGRQGADLQTFMARQGVQDKWRTSDAQTQGEDVDRGFTRSMHDLDRGLIRGSQDYDRSIADLLRGYSRLGNNQAQAMRAAGVAGGGASIQAARKRAENQAWDRAPIDTGFARFKEDDQTARGRLGEDRTLSHGRIREQLARGGVASGWEREDAQRGYDRGLADALTGQGRAFTENEQYGRDMGRLAYASSGQVQPAPLSGAQQAVQGLVIRGNKRYRRLSNGGLAPVDEYGRLIR